MDFATPKDCDPCPDPIRDLDDEPMDTVYCYDCERLVDRWDALRHGGAYICIECDANANHLPFEDEHESI